MNPFVHSLANWWYIRPARRMIREMQTLLGQSGEELTILEVGLEDMKDSGNRRAYFKVIQERLTHIRSINHQAVTLGLRAGDSVERGLRWLKACGYCRKNLGELKAVVARLSDPPQSKAAS